MPRFSRVSLSHLATCDERLQKLAERVVRVMDCSCIEGHRNEATQQDYFERGLSQLRFPESKHNSRPSKAMHLVPYPVRWPREPDDLLPGFPNERLTRNAIRLMIRDYGRFYALAGVVKAEAARMGISIRWGGDWDGDWDFSDQTFDDLGHYEVED